MLRDPGPFEIGVVPNDLQRREATLTEISTVLQQSSDALRVCGPPGSGKTATLRFLLEGSNAYSNAVQSVYTDAWEHRHVKEFLYRILEGLAPETPLTADSKPAHLLEGIDGAIDKPTVVVIDEADMLQDRSQFLYLQDITQLKLILIANRAEALTTGLDPGQQFMIERGEYVPFESYSVDDLVAILEPRAKEGIHGSVETEILEAIGEKASGNARNAIKCLEFAARRADAEGRSSLDREFVQSTMSYAESWVRRKDSDRLREHERTVHDLIREAGEIQMTELYPQYCSLVENPRKERTVRNWIAKMDDYNMVRTSGKTSAKTYEWVPIPEEMAPWLARVA